METIRFLVQGSAESGGGPEDAGATRAGLGPMVRQGRKGGEVGSERETAAWCGERASRNTRNAAISCSQVRVLIPTWRLLIISVSYCLTLLSAAPADPGASAKELHTALMKATFWIEGPTTDPGARTQATCFLVARPSRTDSTTHHWVCVTAAHVLNHMAGDSASLVLRIVDSDGSITPVLSSVPIRLRGRLNRPGFSGELIARPRPVRLE